MSAAGKAGSRAHAPKAGGESTAAAAPQPAFNLTDLLGAASWMQADRSLASALIDFAELERTLTAAKARAADEAAIQLGQSLSRLARSRGLSVYGAAGDIVPYDPALHDVTIATRAPKQVRIVTPGVMRGAGAMAEIVIKALATATRARLR